MQHIDAELLEYLQCARQTTDLIVQRENNRSFIAGR